MGTIFARVLRLVWVRFGRPASALGLPEARRRHQPFKVVLADGQGRDLLQAGHFKVIHARCDFLLIGEAVDFTTGAAQYRH